MAYHVISRDGILVGVTKENAYSFNLPNVSIHEFEEDIPDLNISVWDEATESFIVGAGTISKVTFLSRFSVNERLAIRASTDPIVNDIMKLLEVAEYISTTDPTTINGVNYLAYVGLIAPNRVTEVLT